jgi:hypothetical protein
MVRTRRRQEWRAARRVLLGPGATEKALEMDPPCSYLDPTLVFLREKRKASRGTPRRGNLAI